MFSESAVMRVLRGIFVLVAVGAAILAVVTYVLPREVAVERSVTIEAPPEAIFPHLNSLRATEAWSPWLERDPQVKLVYSGPDFGVGNRMKWESEHPQVGSGTQEITASVENSRVRTALDFGAMGTARASFDLEPDGAVTELTWGFVTDTGMNPFARWMGLMMDRWVGSDYEAGLSRLRELVERGV